MSEHITHIAIYEDLARIALSIPEICAPFKTCIQNQYDSGLLGSASRGNSDYAVPILEKYKDTWNSVKSDREVQIRIAYAIGWLAHRAADTGFSLAFEAAEADPNPLYTNDNCRVYQDAMTFRMVYDGGKRPSLSPKEVFSQATLDYNMRSHPATGSIDVAITEPLLTRMWQADMIKKHVFLEQEDDFDLWVDTFVERYQALTEDVRRYEEAFNHPDPELSRRYYDQDNYYDESDDIIRYVRAIQNGQEPGLDLKSSVEKAKDQSLYARVLRLGYFYLNGASDYFRGDIDKPSFLAILEKRVP